MLACEPAREPHEVRFMSQFISLRVLASLALGQSKKTSNRETPGTPPAGERSEPSGAEREEPTSASRISVRGIRVQP
jgi:hypothetical protein